MKHKSELSLPIELLFDILEPMTVEGVELPFQIDIKEVLLNVVGPSGKPRKVDITRNIDESTMIMLEDEIIDSLSSESSNEEGSV